MRGESTIAIRVIYDETRDESALGYRRIRKLLTAFSKGLLEGRIERHRLPTGFDKPIVVTGKSVASQRQRSRHLLASVVPMLVVLMVLLGAFYPSIDLTAGERERGTLEALLVTPASRVSLMMGKFLTVATIATFTGLVNLGAMGLTVGAGIGSKLGDIGIAFEVPWIAIAAIGALVPLIAMFFAAVHGCGGVARPEL